MSWSKGFTQCMFPLVSYLRICVTEALLVAQMVKNLPTMQETPYLIPELGRSPGEGNGYLLQYSCLGNPIDRGAWWSVRGVTKELDTTDRLILRLFHYLTILLLCSWDIGQRSPVFLVPGTAFVEGNFPTDWSGRGGVGDVSSTLNYRALHFYYYCIRSWRLGTPGSEDLEANPPHSLLVALGLQCFVGFSLVPASRGYSRWRARAVGCSGFCSFP